MSSDGIIIQIRFTVDENVKTAYKWMTGDWMLRRTQQKRVF